MIGDDPPFLLLLVSVFPQAFFALVGGHFVFFSFFTARHNRFGLLRPYPPEGRRGVG
jgi:hypothetical protein